MDSANNFPMPKNDGQMLQDSIFKIGKVTSVRGRSIEVKVDKSKNTSHLLYKGRLLKNISVGSYIKILKGFTKIIGKIEGEHVTEEILFEKIRHEKKQPFRESRREQTKKEYRKQTDKVNRVLNVSLFGFFGKKGFERGIKELPLIDNECFLLEEKEFNDVHDFIKPGDEPIAIGSLSLEKGQKISIGASSLFASHIGIFGNTGSGKSYTLAKIYRELFQKYKGSGNFKARSHFFLIDFNGEYIGENAVIEKKYKNRYRLSTREREGKDKFPVTQESINEPDFWTVFLTATAQTQSPFLKRTLEKDNIDSTEIADIIRDIITNEDRKIDKELIFSFLWKIKPFLKSEIDISQLRMNLKYHSMYNTYYFEKEQKKTTGQKDAIYANSSIDPFMKKFNEYLGGDAWSCLKENSGLSDLQKIRLKIIYFYYDEIVRGFSNKKHLGPLISRLDKRIDDLEKIIEIEDNSQKEKNNGQEEKFFTVVSLKDVNIDMKKIFPLLICRQLYDQKKKDDKKEKFLNLIIDEAHNILSHSSERESETWKDYRLETFEEIIKEGRKFGVFLTIASQRPADISVTIISQLHNYFLHRLINNNDILAVEKTISYLDKASSESISIMPTGTCILTGLAAQVPVFIDIGQIEPKKHAPDNETIDLAAKWRAKD